MSREIHYVQEVPNEDRDYAVVSSGRTSESVTPPWSPAQIIGVIVGIGFTVLGFAAVARTGFDTGHIYTPHDVVWRLPHSPLLALIEVGFGVLVLLSSVVPGGIRTLMALLGAISVAFGIVVLAADTPNRLNHWLGVTHRNGWLYTVVGAVLVLAALASPVFAGRSRRRVVRDEHVLA